MSIRSISTFLAAFAVTGLLAAPQAITPPPAGQCAVVFDGRIAQQTTPEDFDKATSVFNNQFVKGKDQTWAQIIKFPTVPQSLFDTPKNAKALEVTISDQSIFSPGPVPQNGFRRSELLATAAAITQGTTTIHWSIRNDATRPVNITHEYRALFVETADFSTSQFTFLFGTPFDVGKDPNVSAAKTLRLTGRQSNTPQTQFFETDFTDDVWHNFALTVAWDANTLALSYSKDQEALKEVVPPTFNDNSGGGQLHVGMLKLPTGPTNDVVNEGFQESPINEGLTFGGIFVENSADGCISRQR